MGQDAAARVARSEVGAGPDAVVVAGVAGGCDPALAAGTVVLATSLCDCAGAPLEAPLARPPVAGATLGTVASCDALVDDAGTRTRLAAAGVLAVETEAAGWAAACARTGVPLVVVRAIVDTPEHPLGAAAALVRAGEKGPAARRLARLLVRPAAWGTLARLARQAPRAESRAATAAVAAAVALRPGG